MKEQPSPIERATLALIKIARRMFRNTWVHRLPVTSWVFKRLFLLSHKREEKLINFRGKELYVHTKDVSMVPSIINQDYEELELNTYRTLLKPGMTVLDVGSNLGIYALIGSDSVGAKGKVYAFEPVPENIAILRKNVEHNKARNVTIVTKALGEKRGQTKITLAKDSIGTHSIAAKPGSEKITIELETIDNFVRDKKLSVDLIKMDVEGYEGQVLAGGKKTIGKGVDLLLEFDTGMLRRSGTNTEDLAESLMKLYKNCFEIDERKSGLSRIKTSRQLASLANSNVLLTNRSNLPKGLL